MRGDAAIQEVRERMTVKRRLTIMYANAHTLNTAAGDAGFRAALNGSDLVLNDGAGVTLAGRLKRSPFHENLNGSDFNLRLLETASEEGWRVFLLGGLPGVAELAAANIRKRLPALEIVGTRHGFFRDPAGDAAAVRRSGAEVVMVALGHPRQELWLADHLAESGAACGVGVGAFLDFQSGTIRRAPRWMNRLGIEWLYRLAQEPRRLWRRYLVGNPTFVYRVVRETAAARSGSATVAGSEPALPVRRGRAVRHFGPDPAQVGGMSSVIRIVAEHKIGGETIEVQPTWSPRSMLHTLRLALVAALSILRMPRDGVAHLHLSERGSFIREGALVALARGRGLATVVTIHGAYFVPFARRRPAWVGRVLGRAHLVTCLDQDALDLVRKLAPTVRAEIVPNPVPMEASVTGADRSGEIVVFAGEIGYRKGADVLLRAWPLVAEECPEARCIMVGPINGFKVPETKGLEVRREVDPAGVRELLREARAVALPSRAEGMPMILTEAMSGGRPFVSTPIGGIPELAREGGMLVAVDDAAGLARCLTELLRDPELARHLGDRGRRFCAATRSVAVVDERLRTLYEFAAGCASASSSHLSAPTEI
jgi:exopolysaccharide biosynthesis WecB/TagA/CpsF family protein